MDRPQQDEQESASNGKQFVTMIGITIGCILAAWLLVEALELVM
jgi:hypothetical protein